jgi:hypothetical protein
MALTCVTAGNLPKAIEIDFDIDQLLYETNTLMDRLRDDLSDLCSRRFLARQHPAVSAGFPQCRRNAPSPSKEEIAMPKNNRSPKSEVQHSALAASTD